MFEVKVTSTETYTEQTLNDALDKAKDLLDGGASEVLIEVGEYLMRITKPG